MFPHNIEIAYCCGVTSPYLYVFITILWRKVADLRFGIWFGQIGIWYCLTAKSQIFGKAYLNYMVLGYGSWTTISLRKLILLDGSNDQIVNTIAQQNTDIYKKANKDMKTMYFEKYTRLNKIVKLGKYSYYMQKI